MKPLHCQIVRLLTGSVSAVLVSIDSPLWWLAVVPWTVLCIFGLIATIPVLIVIGIGAGGAQADWMSDSFIIGLVFVTPTVLAIVIAELYRWWSRRSSASGVDVNRANRLAEQDAGDQAPAAVE